MFRPFDISAHKQNDQQLQYCQIARHWSLQKFMTGQGYASQLYVLYFMTDRVTGLVKDVFSSEKVLVDIVGRHN